MCPRLTRLCTSARGSTSVPRALLRSALFVGALVALAACCGLAAGLWVLGLSISLAWLWTAFLGP